MEYLIDNINKNIHSKIVVQDTTSECICPKAMCKIL